MGCRHSLHEWLGVEEAAGVSGLVGWSRCDRRGRDVRRAVIIHRRAADGLASVRVEVAFDREVVTVGLLGTIAAVASAGSIGAARCSALARHLESTHQAAVLM